METSNRVTSRYNFHVPVDDGALLYNANTGAVLQLRGSDAAGLAAALCGDLLEVGDQDLPVELTTQLREGGFLVASGTDELTLIRERFARARGEAPLVITLTTTMDCNLGCYYCYEQRSAQQLRATDVPTIVETTREKLRAHSRKSLHVDWYGGEPLLNIDFIEAASAALQVMCEGEGVVYHASVISNGTVWPQDAAGFIARHRIRQVQVSFDGLHDNHNRRRRFRRGREHPEATSFDLIAGLVDRLLECVRVDLRFNMDRHNRQDLLPFVEFARTRGWFARPHRAVIQPARLASYTDHSAFMREREMPLEEFDALRETLRSKAGADVQIEEGEVPDGFPYPRTSVCAALATYSSVIGADGLRYRCGLQVGERPRAVGSVRAGAQGEVFPDVAWWDAFDPTTLPSCSRCSFLPICWGGCPKKHLDGDKHALDEQSLDWKTNLPRLVASRFGLETPVGFAYKEADQFR